MHGTCSLNDGETLMRSPSVQVDISPGLANKVDCCSRGYCSEAGLVDFLESFLIPAAPFFAKPVPSRDTLTASFPLGH